MNPSTTMFIVGWQAWNFQENHVYFGDCGVVVTTVKVAMTAEEMIGTNHGTGCAIRNVLNLYRGVVAYDHSSFRSQNLVSRGGHDIFIER